LGTYADLGLWNTLISVSFTNSALLRIAAFENSTTYTSIPFTPHYQVAVLASVKKCPFILHLVFILLFTFWKLPAVRHLTVLHSLVEVFICR